jgi:hypothetical protein
MHRLGKGEILGQAAVESSTAVETPAAGVEVN